MGLLLHPYAVTFTQCTELLFDALFKLFGSRDVYFSVFQRVDSICFFVTSWGHAEEYTIHTFFRNKGTADILLAKNSRRPKFDFLALSTYPALTAASDQLWQKKEDNQN